MNLRADPQLSTLFKLAYALEVPPSLLLPGGVGDEVVAALDDVAAFSASYIDRRRFAAADMVLIDHAHARFPTRLLGWQNDMPRSVPLCILQR